jgi:hypothetical protein
LVTSSLNQLILINLGNCHQIWLAGQLGSFNFNPIISFFIHFIFPIGECQ